MSELQALHARLDYDQRAGNLEGQANTLLKLISIANHDVRSNHNEAGMGILQGLCLQACAVYRLMGDRKRMASVIKVMVDTMYAYWNDEIDGFEGPRLPRNEFFDVFRMAASIFAEVGYIQGQAHVCKIIAKFSHGEERRLALEQALMIYERLDNCPEQATVLLALSSSYQIGSEERQRILARALELYEALNDEAGQKAVHERMKQVEPPPTRPWHTWE